MNYPDLARDVAVGATVLVDSGLLRMRVVEKDTDSIRCEVLTPGELGSRRHINLPGVEVNLPSLTEKDQIDLRAGVEGGNRFCCPLVCSPRQRHPRFCGNFLMNSARPLESLPRSRSAPAFEHMEEIIREADAVMVARGDLGIEIDYHRLPLVQTQLVRACQAEGKPVIIATHLLESMIHSPMPTRAEISDVSNAVRERADAVMLSGETTTGRVSARIGRGAQKIIESIEPTVDGALNSRMKLREPKAKMLRSAAVSRRILVIRESLFSRRSGFLAYVLGALRPRGVPIYAFTDIESTFRQLLLPWGVEPFLMEFSDDPEQTIRDAIAYLRQKGWCIRERTWLVAITNVMAGNRSSTRCSCVRWDRPHGARVSSPELSITTWNLRASQKRVSPARPTLAGSTPVSQRSSPGSCCFFSSASWRLSAMSRPVGRSTMPFTW